MSLLEFNKLNNYWCDQTERGNTLYHKAQHGQAIKYYEQALLSSELMFRNIDDAQIHDIQVVSPFSVACMNMAHNFWAMQDLKKAGNYFFYNVWRLKKLSDKNGINADLYFEAIKNWQKAALAITHFYQQTTQKLAVDFWKQETYDTINNARMLFVKNKSSLN